MARVLVLGCGKLGLPLARLLTAEGHDVLGARRAPPTVAEEGDPAWLKMDVTDRSAVATMPNEFELAVIILTPAARSPDGYHQIYQDGLDGVLDRLGAAPHRTRLLFISATSVYGQQHGEWVDEQSETSPDTYNGKSLLAAERTVAAFNPRSTVLRFAGIYGAGRTRLLKTLEQPQQIQKSPPLYTNRIHQQDCIRVLHLLSTLHLSGNPAPQTVVASDDDPAPRFEMMRWLADRAGLIAPTAAEQSPEARQNKRVHNALLHSLDFTFAYPTYRDGYAAMLG